MFVVTITADDGEWFGTVVLNNDEIDKHDKITTEAERLGFNWSSTRPDTYDDLMQAMSVAADVLPTRAT